MKISIVVAYFNEVEEMKRWFRNVEETIESEHEYEIIVVCDVTSPVFEHPLITKTIRTEKKGFSKVFNEGIRSCTGDTIVISNADVRVTTKGWTSLMLRAMQESGAWAVHTCVNHDPLPNGEFGWAVEKRLLPSFWWMLNKESPCLLFDERYAESGGQYFDDFDYCQEIYSRGGKLIKLNSVVVWHDSHGYQHTNPKREDARQINKKVFAEKWGRIPPDFEGV